MIFGKKEIDFIDNLQLLYESNLLRIELFPSSTPELEKIINAVCDKNERDNWTDSSGKSDPPPDFYSDKYKLMMDVMRVNDHEKRGKKGKLYNPSMAHEQEMYMELEQAGIIKQFPNAKVFLTGQTQLPTYEDHNYNLYLKCFNRVVSKHIDNIPLYKENHPGYKVIFLLFDESSAYFEANMNIDPMKQLIKGERMEGRPHFYFLDKAFLDAFTRKEIDYLFWFTPYKMFENITPPIELPNLCVYDLSKEHEYCMEYDVSKMSSVEI